MKFNLIILTSLMTTALSSGQLAPPAQSIDLPVPTAYATQLKVQQELAESNQQSFYLSDQ